MAAQILEGDVLKTSFGYRCIAQDGHECYSLSEKIIDDWLYHHNVAHEKEVLYPSDEILNDTGLRADWRVKDVLIEFAGLLVDPIYAAKIDRKKKLCEKFSIDLIILEPEDIGNLEDNLSKIL